MSDSRIYRCSDGHYYAASWAAPFFKSVHLGIGTHFQKCPVDGRWRRATLVNRNDLSDAELQQAESHSFA